MNNIKITTESSKELIKNKSWWLIYDENFPFSERESKEIILKTINNKCGKAYSVQFNNKVIGIAVVHYLINPNIIFLLFIAIKSENRHQHIGKELFNYICKDGDRWFSKKGKRLEGCIWEIENPFIQRTEKEESNAMSTLNFYKKIGGEILPYSYLMPPLHSRSVVTPLLLMFKKNNIKKDINGIYIKNIIRAIYFDKYAKIDEVRIDVLKTLFKMIKRVYIR
jgi:hypothetical protein